MQDAGYILKELPTACFSIVMFVLRRVIGREFHLTNSQKLGMTSPWVPHLSYEENRVLHAF